MSHCYPSHLRAYASLAAVTLTTLSATAQIATSKAPVAPQTKPTVTEQVTVVATGVPTPLADSGSPITILTDADYPYSPEVQQPLRLVPGLQLTQNGGAGGVTSLFIRGGESRANKVLIDGVPLNDVGGLVNFANVATVGISTIEVLRDPNSALYGSDALAGVVLLSTARGGSATPNITVSADGGNLGTHREQVSAGLARNHVDAFTDFARLDTANNLPNNQFHNATVAGNYGYTPDSRTDARFTFRHVGTNGGQPNTYNFFLISDAANQKEQDTFLNGAINHQTTPSWHNLVRYGHEALNAQFYQYGATGISYAPSGVYVGKQVTITGANGYSVSGQAILQYDSGASQYLSSARRDFVYAQTDYKISAHLTALAAFKYEAERGTGITAYATNTVDRRNQSYTLQVAGDVRNRLFYTLGSGIEKNQVFGTALSPRASVAFYAIQPAGQGIFNGTKLHGSFGKGIKESNVFEQNSSLFSLLDPVLIAKYHVSQLGAEYSRTYDAGVEQFLLNSRLRLNATYFHNQFTNGIQFLGKNALIQLGVPKDVANAAAAAGYGAYVNSQAFRAQGLELESELHVTDRVFLRAGYTRLDALVQRSFSSDALHPTFNTAGNFGTVAIGAYAPLVGARPFRRAPNSGYFAVSYAHKRLAAQLTGSLIGKRDDSTFLSDKDFGNSLLLPNRDLDPAYQRLELSADYRITRNITSYVNVQNLLNQTYTESFGYPALPIAFRSGLKLSFGGGILPIK